MPNKRVASKRPRHDDVPTGDLHFTQPQHQARYINLKTKPFGITRTIEWGDLETIGLADKVLSLISHNGWDKVFAIEEVAYREITLEVLSTIKVVRPHGVTFCALGVTRTMSDLQFGLYLGLYDKEFINLSSSRELPIDFPARMTHTRFWNLISGFRSNESKKASRLLKPEHRYIQGLFSHGIAGRNDSTGEITRADLLMLYSTTERYPINLGRLCADLLVRQGTYARLGAIFAGPYVTRLMRGMGLIARIAGMQVVGGTTPLGLATLCAMGLVDQRGDGYTLIRHSVTGERVVDPPSQSEPEPREDASVELRLQEIQSEIQSLRRGHQEAMIILGQLTRDMSEVLSFIRRSSFSAGTSFGTTTSIAPAAPTETRPED